MKWTALCYLGIRLPGDKEEILRSIKLILTRCFRSTGIDGWKGSEHLNYSGNETRQAGLDTEIRCGKFSTDDIYLN